MAPAAAGERREPDEAEFWQSHLAVLRQALVMRQPDARDRIRSAAARLEREVAALNARRELARRRQRWSEPQCAATGDQLDDQIARRLRRLSDLAALLRKHALPSGTSDGGATPEAAARPTVIDPVTMLHGKGKLNEDQVRAAREIAWVHEAITRAGRARVSRLSQIDPPGGWQEMALPERAALVHAKRFLPWAEGLRREAPMTLDIVLQVVVLGLSVYAVARRHRLGWNACVARLGEGLELYWRRPARRPAPDGRR